MNSTPSNDRPRRSSSRPGETRVLRRPPRGEVTVVDVTDPEFLRRFVTEQGKILPIRLTNLSAKQQRELKKGIRRARSVGLMM